MKDITPLLFKTGNSYLKKNKEMLNTQMETLSAINDDCFMKYQTLDGLIKECKESNQANYDEICKISEYMGRIEKISETIDSMKAEAQLLEDYIDRVENKFNEFHEIRDLVVKK